MSHDLRFERLIDAPPEQVFETFTQPDGQEAFYGQDDEGWIVRSECDLRVGGTWTVEFGPSPNELYRHTHVFRVIERPRRLVLASTETRLDGSSFTTQLEFTFEERDGKTLVTMLHTGFPTEELRDEHRRGVPNAFDRLERVLGTGPPYSRMVLDAPPAAVLAALRETLRARGMTEYAVVDHGHDMAAAGAPGFTAWTLVFGNPAAGAKLLARDLAAAVDIPLRLAVIGADGGGTEIVLRDMRTLLRDDASDLADAFTGVLRALAAEARERTEGG